MQTRKSVSFGKGEEERRGERAVRLGSFEILKSAKSKLILSDVSLTASELF